MGINSLSPSLNNGIGGRSKEILIFCLDMNSHVDLIHDSVRSSGSYFEYCRLRTFKSVPVSIYRHSILDLIRCPVIVFFHVCSTMSAICEMFIFKYILFNPIPCVFEVPYSIALGNLEHIPDLGSRRRSRGHIIDMHSFSVIVSAGKAYIKEGRHTLVRAVQDSYLSL